MQIIKELVQIITRVKLRSIRKLGFPFVHDNRLGEMYDYFLEDKSEEDIAAYLTGKSIKSGAYRRLKSDLNDRLIASLFLVDLSLPAYNDRQRAYYELLKTWTTAKVLLGKNARLAGIELAERSLRQALLFEFNDLALDLSRNLSLLYATVIGDTKKYQTYNDIYLRLKKVVAAEFQAEEAYAELIIQYVRQKTDDITISEKANEYSVSLAPLLDQFDAYNLHLYGGLIKMMVSSSKGDYALTAQFCDEWIAFFEKKEYLASVPLQIAYYQKLNCQFQLRSFDEKMLYVDKGLKLLETGSYNWFKFLETYLLLALHTHEYERAYKTYKQAREHKRFKSLTEEVKEYWRVLGAYLHYLVEMGEIPIAQNDPAFSKFRIGRFLNQTPHFSKDKRGVNVSILIIQILFLIARGKYNATIDKMDAVEQYSRRHLFRDETLRAFYFIKALLVIPKNSFHKEAVKRKAEKYLLKLNEYPLEEVGPSSTLTEIIPFEVVWIKVMTQLSAKFYK